LVMIVASEATPGEAVPAPREDLLDSPAGERAWRTAGPGGSDPGRPAWIRTSRPRRSPRAFPRGRVEEILSVRRNGLSRRGLRCYNHDQLHTALGGSSPMPFLVNKVCGHYS